ncbi:MAG: ATP phosphoribosyltransferase [Epulopiscium sp.]|nr:ATP phosphoribosyltransferase [Candidatus Epulonipiscium sp.]
MKQITFALGKGRLAKSAMKVLNELGIKCSEMEEKSRKLVFTSDDGKYKFFLCKVSDVPTFVDYGVADIGIVGKDTILEQGKNVLEVMDLGFAKCKMAVAGKPEALDKYNNGGAIRVATTFPNIANEFFNNKRKQNIEIIKLHGSVELAPMVGLSDVIVDIVESGATLKENGMVVFEDIVDISARVIVNPASMKIAYGEINDLTEKMRKQFAK